MNDILFEALKGVIFVFIVVVMRYIVPWLKENTDFIKNKILIDIAKAAVQYAEQTIESKGAEKKLIVTEFLKKQLKAKNISISDEQLNALIESAVYALNNAKKKD